MITRKLIIKKLNTLMNSMDELNYELKHIEVPEHISMFSVSAGGDLKQIHQHLTGLNMDLLPVSLQVHFEDIEEEIIPFLDFFGDDNVEDISIADGMWDMRDEFRSVYEDLNGYVPSAYEEFVDWDDILRDEFWNTMGDQVFYVEDADLIFYKKQDFGY